VEDSALELEWVGSQKDVPDRGTLAVLSVDQSITKVSFKQCTVAFKVSTVWVLKVPPRKENFVKSYL